jgi:hypothetical protein
MRAEVPRERDLSHKSKRRLLRDKSCPLEPVTCSPAHGMGAAVTAARFPGQCRSRVTLQLLARIAYGGEHNRT